LRRTNRRRADPCSLRQRSSDAVHKERVAFLAPYLSVRYFLSIKQTFSIIFNQVCNEIKCSQLASKRFEISFERPA
jgi:hypothetical protein